MKKTLKYAISAMFLIPVISPLINVEAEACTGIYVGSEASDDGTIMISRCGDTSPNTTSVYLNITEVSDEAGRTVVGRNDFEYELPNHTYKYISVPRQPVIAKGNYWDSSAINEMGLAITATVTGYACDEALSADPYVSKGLSEDNIAGIVAACCTTSKEAIDLLASIIDEYGSAESNIVMVADKKEAWYMEIYTGHQYAAVKMPSDKVAVFGNEFMLESLKPFGTAVVKSRELTSLPEESEFIEYGADGSINLFDTYAGKKRLADYANLRTWRGHNILSPSTSGEYDTYTKYPLFFDPDYKVSTKDVISILRDRMNGIMSEDELSEGRTRVIATESTYQAHVTKIHPNLPAEKSIEEWLCLSNTAYAPFVPISNALTKISEPYGFVLESYNLDERSAAHVYKKLNALAAQNREIYGINIERFWTVMEDIWMKQYSDTLSKSPEDLTQLSLDIQEKAYTEAKRIFDELIWFLMRKTETLKYDFSYSELAFSDEKNETYPFIPQIDLEYYTTSQGYKCQKTDKGLSLSKDDSTITFTPSDGHRNSLGTMQIDDNEVEEAEVQSKDGRLYMELWTAFEILNP